MGKCHPQCDNLLMGAGAHLGSFEAASPQVLCPHPVPPVMCRAQSQRRVAWNVDDDTSRSA